MSLKSFTPCDTEGHCPYDASYNCDCEWYCGADEPEDDCDYEVGYDPYCGCFTDDCQKGEKEMDKIVCAVFDETCPYCDEEGYCRMEEDEGLLPFDECDAFYVFEEEEN